MINRVSLRNFGPLVNLEWDKLSNLNVIIARNGGGKTFLLRLQTH